MGCNFKGGTKEATNSDGSSFTVLHFNIYNRQHKKNRFCDPLIQDNPGEPVPYHKQSDTLTPAIIITIHLSTSNQSSPFTTTSESSYLHPLLPSMPSFI